MEKSPLLIFITVAVSSFSLFAQEVAEEEFINTEVIEFINYSGTYEVINSLEQIIGIGSTLGENVEPGASRDVRFGPYRIVHSYEPDNPVGLDGDILIMGEASRVDSITNLRHIIGGYLTSAYGYDEEKAFTLAVFITYYNALWYQKIEHFSSKYKSGVLHHLESDQCGLARIWSEWPGKARIVIPLKGPGYGAEGVDGSLISQDEVIEVMREEDDKRIEERKDLVEIREEENSEQGEELEKQEEQLVEREEAIKDEISALESEEELTQEEEQTLEQLRDEEKDIQEERIQLEEEKEKLEQSNEEVLDMRDDIAVDENEIIDNGDDEVEKKESVFTSPAEDESVPFFFFSQKGAEEGFAYGSIELYDLTAGSREKESTLTIIYGRTFKEYDGAFLAVAKDRDTNRVLAMTLDKENLAVSQKTREEIYPGSQVVVDKSNQIYLVFKQDGWWSLGRFDKNLDLQASSQKEVNPMTDIQLFNGQIFVQGISGELIILNGESLLVDKELK